MIFNTKMDTSGFGKGMKELSSKMLDLKNKVKTTENQITSLQEELEGLTKNPVKIQALKNLEKQTAHLEAKIKTTKQTLEDIGNSEIKSKTVVSLEKQIEKTSDKLQSLISQATNLENEKSVEFGVSDDALYTLLEQDKAWLKLRNQINATENELEQYNVKLKQTVADGGLDGKNSEEYTKKAEQLKKLEEKLRTVKKEEEQVKSVSDNISGKDTAEYKAKKQKLTELTGQLEIYKAKLRETKEKENSTTSETEKVSNAFERLKKCVSNAGKSLSSAFKTGAVNLIKKIGGYAKNSATEMSGLTKIFNSIKEIVK